MCYLLKIAYCQNLTLPSTEDSILLEFARAVYLEKHYCQNLGLSVLSISALSTEESILTKFACAIYLLFACAIYLLKIVYLQSLPIVLRIVYCQTHPCYSLKITKLPKLTRVDISINKPMKSEVVV